MLYTVLADRRQGLSLQLDSDFSFLPWEQAEKSSFETPTKRKKNYSEPLLQKTTSGVVVTHSDVSFLPWEQAENILSTKQLHKNIVNWETLLVSRKILAFCTLLRPEIKAVDQLFQALGFVNSTLDAER